MANEILISVSMSRKDPTNASTLYNNHNIPPFIRSFDQTLKRHFDQIFAIGTTEENVTFGDITTNGFLVMINLATANFVEWGTTTTDYPGKMLAGDIAGPFRLNASKTLYLKSDTAASDVRIIMYGG